MSDPAIQNRFRRILGRVQQPARLVGQETGSGPGFSGRPDETRLVLGFPDTYEIGISNQAIQVLYHVARGVPGVGVERTYLPWVDVIAEMRKDSVPLLTLETWSAVSSSHLLAFTLQHEFNYTNLLEMLDLVGIPLLAAERAESEPLVIAGGPATANFFPMAPFLDAVAVGEGEAMLVDILDCVGEGRRQGTGRGELKTSLSRISGVFVPGVSETVRKRSLPRLEGAPYPSAPLVPLTAGVHDRAWVEVMRGCTRGCRFCQAGMWYRPVRERRPESVLALAGEVMAATGHQELAFGSLSTTDYSAIGELLDRTAQTYPEVKVSLPSLRVDSAAVRLARLVSPTGPSVTLAPEAGSQRMRDVINKNVTEEDILGAAEEAFRTGRTTLKLYFMIGLPTETHEDIVAIADLVARLRDLGRRCLGSRSSRLRLNVSINNFVPKPFTPFQWSGMPARDVLQQRQALLRSRLRLPGVRVALHDIGKSYLEGALARGGEEMARVILSAWERGARFDSWTEQFKAQAWDGALTDAGITAEDLACKEYAHDDLLPWDRIRGVVGAEFLWSERLRALRGETTSDCRREGCQSCGACPAAPGNDLAEASAPPASSSAPVLRVPKGSTGEGPRGLGPRYLITFSVSDRACFIGHLDKTEIFRRAVRRAGGRLALSEGMRPKAILTLVLPLAVGVCGRGEMCEFELAEEPP
ncbi:MAG TPA: TIGR03960 family B12-binding radical SAM protein, partial [Thermoleophilia bacterium]